MKTKTSTLTGPALDWAVAKAMGEGVIIASPIIGMPVEVVTEKFRLPFNPSDNWNQCGPLIEKYQLHVLHSVRGLRPDEPWFCDDSGETFYSNGSTPQIAICRAVVAAKLGDEVELPEGLM